MITTAYTLSPAADGLYTVMAEDGAAMTHPLPLDRAADLVRRFENGRHQGESDWRVLTADDIPTLLASLGLSATETLEAEVIPGVTETFEVETVDIAEIRRDDQVIWEGAETPYFLPSRRDAYRIYWLNPNGTVCYGDYTVLLGGVERKIAPGTTLRRAVAPEAVRLAENIARRNAMNALGRGQR